METLKDIRECYMQDQYFKLMGYDFVVPAGRNAYNHLRKKYHTLASQAQQRFIECERDFATIDDLLDGAVDALCYSLEDTLKAAVSDCVSIGVYDIDTENAKIFATSQTVTFVVTAETALDDATLRSIEESYLMTFGQQVEIKRGYLSTVQVDVYGTQKTANVQAVYIKGDGWKIPIESAEAIWSRG